MTPPCAPTPHSHLRVGPRGQQGIGYRFELLRPGAVPVVYCLVQGSVPVQVHCPHIRPCLQQRGHNGDVRIPGGQVQRGGQLAGRLGVGLGTCGGGGATAARWRRQEVAAVLAMRCWVADRWFRSWARAEGLLKAAFAAAHARRIGQHTAAWQRALSQALSAPAVSSAMAISGYPPWAAKCSGVWPRLSTHVALAPALRPTSRAMTGYTQRAVALRQHSVPPAQQPGRQSGTSPSSRAAHPLPAAPLQSRCAPGLPPGGAGSWSWACPRAPAWPWRQAAPPQCRSCHPVWPCAARSGCAGPPGGRTVGLISAGFGPLPLCPCSEPSHRPREERAGIPV